ncbi:hypothetical protein QNI19_38090 [Cytophagaceae bacterium DM2B3-1]|uniref:XRE family transcriptional regulator n=1 Tax=Xanthocytophaga flava TaxID=3048013 RepID=A0ABT7CYJ1_9BACT|nr:hypothetical protein [Xanthocytophaga flavus]MDJ1498803.1 hypothetical protein [Xanthocytophaga flavus]
MKTVPEIFDELIEALGTNYNELAKTIGLNRSDKFYNLKSGKSTPNYETLQAIIKAYPQVNCRFLLTGEGEPLEKETVRISDEFKELVRQIVLEIQQEKF